MCRSGQHDTEDKEDGREDDSRAAAQLINSPAREEHSEDFADQTGVGQVGLDLAGDVVFVQDGEERFHETDDLCVIAV